MKILLSLAMFLTAVSVFAYQTPRNVAAKSDLQTFGSGDFSGETVKLATLLQEFDKYKDKKVVVTGEVKEVCEKEGCWLKLEDQKISVRTIMKDHGFKVPKELKNKTVTLEGTMVQKELPVSAVRHFMKDEGRSDADIQKVDKPQKVFQFVADAVRVDKV